MHLESLRPRRFHRSRWKHSFHLSTYAAWNSPCVIPVKSYFTPVPNHSTFKSLHVLPSIHHNYIGPSEKKQSGLTIVSRIKKFSTELNYIQPEIRPLSKLSTPLWKVRKRQIMYLFDCPKTLISPQETQQRFLYLQNQLHNFYFIFTDGSKDTERTSNAVCCGKDQQVTKTRLNNNTSIYEYIAELPCSIPIPLSYKTTVLSQSCDLYSLSF